MAFCFLFDLAHCSKYCWLNVFLCKQVSLVWQPWRTLWWNVLRPSSLGLPIGLPKELSMCGATSWLLLVLSASTCAWSRLALHMLGIWCLKKSWRETSGMWRMKGGLFQMRRASKSWRSALQSFAEQGHLHRRAERTAMASVGLHGLHTPWDVVAAPLPGLHLSWTQLLFGGTVWCMWCVCVELQAFCIFGLNCLLAGRSDAVRAMTLDRHKVVMDITFIAWCEVNIEFAELLFLWSCGC